ncbi:histidine-rich glycoprotein-like [Macrobrachium nipponense]|uniref:histidine-rich glycoprotein-like n=1 Tax=Macrobrachium nipponense TaxID=159736 RepID=UPI0030C82017
MKFLVVVLLVVATYAADIEKRDAEPDYGYYRPSHGYGYGHPYGAHHHYKRSAEPEPEASYPSGHYPVYPPHGHQYGHYPIYPHHSHHYGKRSADP